MRDFFSRFKFSFPLFKILFSSGKKSQPAVVRVPVLDAAKVIAEAVKEKASAVKKTPVKKAAKKVETVSPFKDDSAPWMKIVRGEIGVKEVPGAGNNPRVLEYHASTSLDEKYAGKDATSWCSSFANWVMKQQGIKGTGSAWARNWTSWGIKLDKPVYGCVAVYERNAPGGDSHVTFYVGDSASKQYDRCIGGNQSDSVRESLYDKKTNLAYRWPKEYPLPIEKSGPTQKPLT